MTETDDAAAAAISAIGTLQRLNGPRELQAGILALLLPPGSRRARKAWKLECKGAPGAQQILEAAVALPPRARLPLLERLVLRMRHQPMEERQALLEATRRVMSARLIHRPLDRLHWLAMRQRLGESTAAETRAAATADLSQLPQSDVSAIASYSAFLARMVPNEAAELEDSAPTETGLAWYAAAMAPWEKRATIPPCEPPDTSALVGALQDLQIIAWMQRPALVRVWVAAALQHSTHGQLNDTAADALRLSCALLESPLPPELARHFDESGAA